MLISLLLLFTYSLGFAHNLIPHNHNSEPKEHIIMHEDGHQHHNHQHKNVKHSHSDHEHVSHGDHYDEDLYDLLVCSLHKTDHQEDDCKDQHFSPSNSHRIIINKLQANMLAVILFSVTTETEQSELISDDQIDSEKTYLSSSLEDTPLRGPPSLKC